MACTGHVTACRHCGNAAGGLQPQVGLANNAVEMLPGRTCHTWLLLYLQVMQGLSQSSNGVLI